MDIYTQDFTLATFEGVIPQVCKFLAILAAPFYFLAGVGFGIWAVSGNSSSHDRVSINYFRWIVVAIIGCILDIPLLDLFSLALAFCSDLSRLKAAFGNGGGSRTGAIPKWVLSILTCVGIIVGIYFASRAEIFMLIGWYTGLSPQPSRGCEARVGLAQSSLFAQHIYASQFARILRTDFSGEYNEYGNFKNFSTFLEFDMQAFDAIQHDQILCNQGFIGNSDLYGLGSRVSLYLQWLTALLVNNFIPRIRNDFRKLYLAYSLGLCIATFVFTFSTACTFAIEIKILYWAYWGGFLCVFATSPSYTRLGSEVRWVGLDWVTGINYFLHISMFYHSIFFWHYGYDQVFSRIPCGTYHFFFAPFLDPSKSFWFLRDALTIISIPVIILLIPIIPTVILVLMYEIKDSICNSSIYQGIYVSGPGRSNSETILTVDTAQTSRSSRFRNGLRALGMFWVKRYRFLRDECCLPPDGRGGIRLITPIDIKQRKRYRRRCAGIGLASFIVFPIAIETTLQSNRVVGVNSIASTGQYLAFVVGFSTFNIALWQALKQEMVRRRDLLRRHNLNKDTADIELETLPHTISGAVRYAFGQADVDLLSNGGVFEAPSGTIAEESEDVSEQASTPSNDPEDSYVMSGAL